MAAQFFALYTPSPPPGGRFKSFAILVHLGHSISEMSKRFYITTAIFYVNGHPHLGHAYEMVLTDVIARARRSLGQEVFFLTGLDEHGQKVQQAAGSEGKTPQAYCDGLAVVWKSFAARLGLTNDDFVRTTEARHKQVVGAILSKLHTEGHFYKAAYPGSFGEVPEFQPIPAKF